MISSHCELVLRRGLTREICQDMRARLSWLLCHAWDIHEKERISFREAVRRSWNDLKSGCLERGVVI